MNDSDDDARTNLVRETMTKLGAKATKIFMALVDGLLAGDARRVDNSNGTFVAVSIDCLVRNEGATGGTRGGSLYAIAHRYEANGDLVPDPDVEFYVVDEPDAPGGKAVYPAAIDHGPLGCYRYIHFDSVGRPARIASRAQPQLARFCDVWMRNIAFQPRSRRGAVEMDRTAEEFVHQLPNGRWFVGDFVGTDARGEDMFLVEVVRGPDGVEVSLPAIADSRVPVRTYSRKASAKRAAQRLIESLLDEDRAGDE